jgi:hypothetical protein
MQEVALLEMQAAEASEGGDDELLAGRCRAALLRRVNRGFVGESGALALLLEERQSARASEAARAREQVEREFKALLQDVGRVILNLNLNSKRRAKPGYVDGDFGAVAAQVLDAMVSVRAAAPFALLDRVAAEIEQQQNQPQGPSLETLARLVSSFAHFDHADVRLLTAAVAAAEGGIGRGGAGGGGGEGGGSGGGGGGREGGGNLAYLTGDELVKLTEGVAKWARSEGVVPLSGVHSLVAPS